MCSTSLVPLYNIHEYKPKQNVKKWLNSVKLIVAFSKVAYLRLWSFVRHIFKIISYLYNIVKMNA